MYQDKIDAIREELIETERLKLHEDETFKNNILLFVKNNGETDFTIYGMQFKLSLQIIE